jgi:hypothetical protein
VITTLIFIVLHPFAAAWWLLGAPFRKAARRLRDRRGAGGAR